MAASSRPASPPTSTRRAEVEARVLAATEELLAAGASYGDLSVERIATAAGISRPAFYFYFRDKRELLMRLTEDVSDLLYAEAEAWWGGDGEEAIAALERALGSVLALYREHSPLLRAVVEASAYDPVVAEFWRALVGRFVAATRARIESEQAAGRADDFPAEATAFGLAWMTERAYYQHLVREGGLADDDLTRALAGTWVRAIYGRVE